MSKLVLAYGLALGLALSGYAPGAAAAKPVRDPVAPLPAQPAAPRPPVAAVPAPNLPALSAAQIAERNAAARGGLQAWRAVKTLRLTGQLDAGGKKETLLPFTLLVKRPHKQYLALEFAGRTSLQVYDGEHGWTYRPYLGRAEPEPFSAEEQRRGAAQQDLDGWLIDYAAKGSRIALAGTEMVEGKGNYKLTLTTHDGVEHHLWIDGSSFLESKIEDEPRRIDGRMRRTETYLRDYRSVDGLVLPFVSETRIEGVRASHSMTVEKAVVNPPLDDAEFTKMSMLTVANAPADHK